MSTDDEMPGDPTPGEPTHDPVAGPSDAEKTPSSPRGGPRHLRMPPHSAARRRTALAAKLVAMVSSLAVLFYSGWAWSIVNSADSSVKRIPIDLNGGGPKALPTATPTAAPGATATPQASPSPSVLPDVDGKSQNIVIVGNDSRAGYTPKELAHVATGPDGGGMATDTIMVLHIPANGSRASIVSIPRDTWVSIPGFPDGKINGAYADGACYPYKGSTNLCNRSLVLSRAQQAAGAQKLVQIVSDLTGLHIDHYVQISLIGFYRLSNAIGGVTVCVKDNVDDPWTGLKLSAGKHTIKGRKALQFVRQRHSFPDGAGDLDRIRRQQEFLAAAANKIISAHWLLEPWKLTSVADSVAGAIVADQHFSIVDLAKQMRDIAAGNVQFLTMPTQGPAPQDPGSLAVNPTITRAFFKQVIAGTVKKAKPKPKKSTTGRTKPTSRTSPKPPQSSHSGSKTKPTTPAFDVQGRTASDNSCVY